MRPGKDNKMDQCTHCTMRGNLQGCLTTACSQHESWMVGELRKALNAAAELMDESHGVTGLHLNGDVAPWDELRTGGRYEEWLVDFDAALVMPNIY